MRAEDIAKRCPTCGAHPGNKCITISGNRTSQPHLARWAEPGTYRERHVYAPYRRRGAGDGSAGAEHTEG